jgi:hypothetical protein
MRREPVLHAVLIALSIQSVGCNFSVDSRKNRPAHQPEGFRATFRPISGDLLLFTWLDAPDAYEYHLFTADEEGEFGQFPSAMRRAQPHTSDHAIGIQIPGPGTTIRAQMRAVDEMGNVIAQTDVLSATTPIPAPVPPAFVSATRDGKEVVVTWVADGMEEFLDVDRSIAGRPWTHLVRLPRGTRAYVDTTAPTEGPVEYRITAENDKGRSESSQPGSTTQSATE